MNLPVVGIITQVRMTSSRLPGKVLLPAGGKPLFSYHIERLRQSGYPIYVATTTNSSDEPIVAFCQAEGMPCYRGSEEDVLSRFHGCATENGLEVIVRVTSDCPLIDGKLLAEGVEQWIAYGSPRCYLSNGIVRSFPRGFDFEVFSYSLLDEAHRLATRPFEREHVTPYFYAGKAEAIAQLYFTQAQDHSQLRLTVDTAEDYRLICLMIEEADAALLGHEEITRRLAARPDWQAINAHIEQKKLGE